MDVDADLEFRQRFSAITDCHNTISCSHLKNDASSSPTVTAFQHWMSNVESVSQHRNKLRANKVQLRRLVQKVRHESRFKSKTFEVKQLIHIQK